MVNLNFLVVFYSLRPRLLEALSLTQLEFTEDIKKWPDQEVESEEASLFNETVKNLVINESPIRVASYSRFGVSRLITCAPIQLQSSETDSSHEE